MATSHQQLTVIGRIDVAGRVLLALVGPQSRAVWLRLDGPEPEDVGTACDLDSVAPTVRIFQRHSWAAGPDERRRIAAEAARLWRAHHRPHAPLGWKDADGRWRQSCSCGGPWPCDPGVRDCEG